MRAEAESKSAHANIRYLAGSADALPLADGSASAAWLSTVIHHVPDLGAAARELRRVLADDAPVLIRGAFPGHLDGIQLFRFFPAARKVAEAFPSIERVAEAFGGAGFRLERVEDVPQVSAPSMAAFADAIAAGRKVDTTLVALSQENFDRGLAEARALATERGEEPVVDRLTLVVLR
jgi:SAM-dependent methyltransferase